MPAGAAHPVLALQAAVGNRAVTALLQRDDKPMPGGPVPSSPLVDARVDGWIDPKYTEYLKRYDNDIQGQHYSVVPRERQVWKSFAKNREADVDVHYLRRRSLTKSEPNHIKVTVVAAPLEDGKWKLTADAVRLDRRLRHPVELGGDDGRDPRHVPVERPDRLHDHRDPAAGASPPPACTSPSATRTSSSSRAVLYCSHSGRRQRKRHLHRSAVHAVKGASRDGGVESCAP